MTLEQYAHLGEIIAAVAVFISLIYLAMEVRRNTRAVRASYFHSVTDSFNQINNAVAADESLARVFRVGTENYQELSADEQVRFNFMFHSAFRVLETLYYESTQGVVEQELWRAEQETIRSLLSRPGGQEWWGQNPLSLTPAFRKFVDDKILSDP